MNFYLVNMRYFFWTLFFILIFCRGGAQNETGKAAWDSSGDYVIRHYNSENGLPQNSAKDLLLDQKKFLWIATEDGLVRFDGQRFRVFNTSNTPLLKSNRFAILSQTPDHDLLIGSSYDRKEIYRISSETNIDTISSRLPYKSVSNRANGIFDFTRLYSHYSLNKAPGVDTALLSKLCESSLIELLNDHELVVRYKNTFYYLNNITAEVFPLPVNAAQQFVSSFFIDDIFCFPGENGKLYFFRHGREIPVTIDESVKKLFAGFRPRPSSTGLQIYVKGDLLLCRHYNDIYRLSLQNNVLKAEPLFKNLFFLDRLEANAIQYDSEAGRLFIGTLNAGLFVVTKRVFNTMTFNSENLNDNVFMAMCGLPQNRILTSNGIFDRTGARGNKLFGEDKPDRNCFYTAADKSIWSSKQNFLYRYDSNFNRRAADSGIFLGDISTCIMEDHAGHLWVSTAFSLFEVKDDKLLFRSDLFPHILGMTIESMAEAEPGILWIATRNGLYSFDIAKKRLNPAPLLPNVDARCIYKAKDGSKWIGTYGNGYYKYAGGTFVHLPLDAKKHLANTHTFLEDGKGFFWITTNHGLFKVRKMDLDSFVVSRDINDTYFYYFDKSYGFNTNEFNGGCNPAALQDKEGFYYFPSLNGIVYFNPDRVQAELPASGIFIDNFQVGAHSLHYLRPIKLKPDFDRIFVDVTTPFYGLSDNLDLAYKLNIAGERWYPVNADGRIIINRLPYGKYSLVIRKRDGWGKNKFTTISIDFEVLPYWYNTRVFYLSLLFLVLVSGFILFKIRTRILLSKNRRLQEKVEQRTHELNQSTIMREKLISLIVHDLRSPLASHIFLIDHLYGNYNKLSAAETDELFFQLKESAGRISHFSSDFLTWYNSQKQGWGINRTPIELTTFLVQVSSFYKEMAHRKNLSFACDIAEGLAVFSDEYILSIIVRNLVDNAVKYTRRGGVTIAAFRDESAVYITVKDTGPGIPAARIKALMEYGDINKVTPTFGYLFILQFIQKLGGRISVESEPQAGTTVTIRLASL